MAAFEQLHAEGYVDGRVGAGSFVSHQLPDERCPARAAGGAAAAAAGPRPPRPLGARREAGRAQAAAAAGPRPFSPGVPELEQFPFDDWARLLARRWRRPRRAFLVGGDPAGYRPLCQAIADYLASARAVSCRPEQVIVVSGTQQALDLAARVLIDPGDPVWIEEPGYPPTRAVLLAAGARPVPVPVDDEGLSVVAGPRARARGAADLGLALAPVPARRHDEPQAPPGAARLGARGRRLRARGRLRQRVPLRRRPLAALQGLDRDGRVIYVGTMSKVMFPGPAGRLHGGAASS